jgi:Flp pilus assembly protein TadG
MALTTARSRNSAAGSRRRADGGSAAVELVLITPIVIVLLLFVVHAGRAGQSVEVVRHAADQGARAASMASRSRMVAAARTAVDADLADAGSPCSSTSVTVTTSVGSLPGGTVTVSVMCEIDTTGLRLLGLRRRTVVASSTEVFDRFRAVT